MHGGPSPYSGLSVEKKELLCARHSQVSGHVAEKTECTVFCVVSVCVWTGYKNLYLPKFCKDTPEINTSDDLCFEEGDGAA